MSVYLGKNKVGITIDENLKEQIDSQETLLAELAEDVNALSDVSNETLTITENGEYDVKDYGKIVVNISGAQDGPDIYPSFAENSWETIKSVIQSGKAGQYWAVGAYKPIIIDGLTYNVRLSDLQQGRYSYADGSRTTNAVLEFEEVYNTAYRMNETDTNAGGWAESELRTTLNTEILEMLPSDLKSLLEEVNVASANGGGSAYTEITTSANKLFIPAAIEIELSSGYGKAEEGTVWDYYKGASNTIKGKKKPNSTSVSPWRLRSPYPSLSDSFSGVGAILSMVSPTSIKASSASGVSMCFAW